MSDVHSETAPARTECGKQIGSHIWYELITPDPEGAKAFYDAVVGWSIGERAPVEHDYRMIGRSVADPDGHIWEFVWMDDAAVEQGAGAVETAVPQPA